jgi:CRP-like cAMP-binding protein
VKTPSAPPPAPVDAPAESRRSRPLELVFQLHAIPLFKGLGAEELLPVAGIATHVSHAAGEVIFEEGALGDHLYVTSSGRVEISRGGQRIAELGPGECFGEMALLDRAPRSATVRVLEDARLVAIARDDFHDLLDLYPAIARAIAVVLAARLREATSRDRRAE